MNRFFAAFERMNTALEPISTEYKRTKYWFYLDALYAAILYGVTPNQYIGFGFYQYNHTKRRTFYTARHQNKYDKVLNSSKYKDVFWNKARFNATFPEHVRRNWICATDASANDITDFIKQNEKIIVKPIGLSSGQGIYILSNSETPEQLAGRDLLLESFIVQHKEMSKLNPECVNTVRVYTLRKEQHVEIITASLRVGGVGAVVDNYHSGGVGYPIDIQYGFVCGKGTNLSGERYGIHPGTNVKVVGFQIPNWDGLTSFVQSAANKIHEAHLIAWDIAVLADGFELIEGNYDGDSGFMQSPSHEGRKQIVLNNVKRIRVQNN